PPRRLRRFPWREAASSSVELLSLRRFPGRTVVAAAYHPSANGDSVRYLSLTPPPPLPPWPSHNPFPSLFPLPSQLSRFPETILLPPPSFTRSSQPPPLIPDPSPSSTSSQPPPPVDPVSHLHHPPTPPTPTAPSPFSYSGPDCPLSIILLRPRQPPSPSSTPLFAL
ncbi:unnamed protein product, partial [Musa textilis]